MKIISAEFIKGAVKPEQYPSLPVPEFAFFGRSNVGKSSLINMLVNRKNLVKTGSRPGMTREVNFFLVNRPSAVPVSEIAGKKNIFALVDLPGYGYAKVSGGVIQKIDSMLYDYCTNRQNLQTIFFLIDMRREPGEIEKNSIAFFQSYNIKVVIVGTKADKLKKNDLAKVTRNWVDFFSVDAESIIPSSASKKLGKERILACVEEQLFEQP
ncbi:YihA family ribosome biogenesis GTP-binding protein [Treponema phagedenis]|uniref:Probable GTP-binding protein EngB n=1 Tax=Treponema phagedenis TaxID=162 RepID=A0AAE6IWW6_TREPH|nr:ribosome biogenesis GTP-binding protein YihA/YsxC [Treponema phagedenis]NVP24869.1 YihA family ribosome biogenesis GTP-binding protein [Treponema phagedenis]QEJ96523.1 YihA family ribosome biogenesis GTP-binding protein [Treponema phagedenis]QEJ99683.1 YihA family ribosome biogenesis GTP-binding protein [Treponema phagedenis]QEK02307.1 YihA family ribosome biogenesis GTP-binding protein [Treponema phagedenis]QEK05233.1 YihA family ribosome biogenesis GTP-binding protein [Treponema phagedeni